MHMFIHNVHAKYLVLSDLSAILYHKTEESKAIKILKENKFRLSTWLGTAADRPKDVEQLWFFSTSTKPGAYKRGYSGVVFVLDGAKLNKKYAGSPFDYWGQDMREVAKNNGRDLDEAEERIFSDTPIIPNASDYIKEIHADWWMPDNQYPRLAWEYPYGPGSGTAEDPYQIWTPKQMNAIGLTPADWGKCFVLMADLDMSVYIGTQYNRIGTGAATPFTGTFEGNGHVIRNLTYSTTAVADYVGLFGYVVGTTIRNLGVENATLSTHGSFVGGVAGHKAGTITGCYATGSFSGNWAVAGLVGNNESGLVENCYAAGSVSGTGEYAGGLVARLWQGTLSNCYSTVKVTGVTTTVGAFVGWNAGGPINGSFWDTQTSGQSKGVGLGDATGLLGKTTIELKTFSTFVNAGWDFANAWGIANHQTYPYLKWLAGFNPADLNYSGTVDMEDLAFVAANWLRQ